MNRLYVASARIEQFTLTTIIITECEQYHQHYDRFGCKQCQYFICLLLPFFFIVYFGFCQLFLLCLLLLLLPATNSYVFVYFIFTINERLRSESQRSATDFREKKTRKGGEHKSTNNTINRAYRNEM